MKMTTLSLIVYSLLLVSCKAENVKLNSAKQLPEDIKDLFINPIYLTSKDDISFVMQEKNAISNDEFYNMENEFVTMSEDGSFKESWIVSKAVGKQYFLPNSDNPLYLYDKYGRIGTVTIIDYKCTSLGFNNTANARCKIQLYPNKKVKYDEFGFNMRAYHVSNLKMDKPMYNKSYKSIRMVDEEFCKSISDQKFSVQYGNYEELSNGKIRYISYSPNLNSEKAKPEMYFYKLENGKRELLYEDDNATGCEFNHLEMTNIICNGKPLIKLNQASFEGHMLHSEYLYFNDGKYHLMDFGYGT